MKLSDGELEFIAALRTFSTHPAARGLADDAAVIELDSHALVLTHDVMVEGRHWLPGQDMADVAWKLVATNLSDLAAKGAAPLGILLGHTLGTGDEGSSPGFTQFSKLTLSPCSAAIRSQEMVRAP
jgi:thiamine-monophosphate kinase